MKMKFAALALVLGLAGSVLAQSADPDPVSAGGKWMKGQYTDKLTGVSDTTFILYAEEPSTDFIGFTCKAGRVSDVAIHTDTVVNYYAPYGNKRATVAYRSTGDKKIHNEWVTVSDTGTVFFLNSRLIGTSFINDTKFIVRYQSASGLMHTDEFTTEGLTKEMYESSCR